jgi:hypothetical protein
MRPIRRISATETSPLRTSAAAYAAAAAAPPSSHWAADSVPVPTSHSTAAIAVAAISARTTVRTSGRSGT